MKYFLLGFLLLVACTNGSIQTSTIEVPVSNTQPAVDDITQLINDENDYRLSIGQTELSKGLSCVLYTITGGSLIQSNLTGVSQVASYTFVGVFNQPNANISDGLSVLPPALKSVYLNMFLLRCQGQIVITKTDFYKFDLSSDDGSVLYLDGSKIIDNDGSHGVITVSGQKLLRRGVHIFRLDFAQTGGGNQALILKQNSDLTNPNTMFH